MNLTVNFRNNTDFFIKVNGIDDVIVPNSLIEDKTIQWFTSENKVIDVYPTIACVEPKICSGTIEFVENDAVYVQRGDISGTQTVKVQWDITGLGDNKIQEENSETQKLCNWGDLSEESLFNVSYYKI